MTAALLFRILLMDPAECGNGCCPDGSRDLIPHGDPVDADGLAVLLRSGEHGTRLRLALVGDWGRADVPLTLHVGCPEPGAWTVSGPGGCTVAVIPAPVASTAGAS